MTRRRVVVLGLALIGCGSTPGPSGQSGGHGGVTGAGVPSGGHGGATGTAGDATGSAGAAATGGAGVNGPSGPGPIVSFGDGDSLSSVAWSGSTLVAIGGHSALFQSSGTSGKWTFGGSPFFTSQGGVALWDGKRFVTVDPNGSVNIGSAADAGTAATLLPPAGTSGLVGTRALAWSGSSYVAVGDGGMVASSPDAMTWTRRTSGTTDSLVGIVWTGSQFLALGSAGTVVVSPDGVTWTVQRTALANLTFTALVWSGSRFVAVGNQFTQTSTDGKTWTETDRTPAFTCIAWSAQLGLFAAAAGTIVATSPDGATWTSHTTAPGMPIQSIVWAGNRFVAVGGEGIILSSRDGAQWIVESMGISLSSVIWTGQQFVAGGDAGVFLTSSDGLSWTIGNTGTSSQLLSSAATPNGYAFGSPRFLLWTPDLKSWTTAPVGLAACTGLIWTGAECLAVCGTESFWAAADCQAWSSGTIAAATDQWINVVWTGSLFVAVGAGGQIATSSDGTKWTTQVSGTTQTLSAVAWSGQQLVAVGNGIATTSPDGVTWTAGPIPQGLALDGVAWAGTRFLAVGPQATLLQSPDGTTWTGTATTVPVNSLLSSTLTAIAFSGTRSIVVGANGIILAVDR